MASETLYFYAAPNGVATSKEFKSRLAAANYKKLHLEELHEILDTEKDEDVLEQTRARIECINASHIETLKLELEKKPSRKRVSIDRKYGELINNILENDNITTDEGIAQLLKLEQEYIAECKRRNIKT